MPERISLIPQLIMVSRERERGKGREGEGNKEVHVQYIHKGGRIKEREEKKDEC